MLRGVFQAACIFGLPLADVASRDPFRICHALELEPGDEHASRIAVVLHGRVRARHGLPREEEILVRGVQRGKLQANSNLPKQLSLGHERTSFRRYFSGCEAPP
jgi:hypothetical protein